MTRNYLFTSESVSPGHPDKLCDQLSDTVLDYVLGKDKKSRVACEVLAKGELNNPGSIVVAGEITTENELDFDDELREKICDIGYDTDMLGFNGQKCEIKKIINKQSPDIKIGVDKNNKEDQGAGDQGLMFGYASDETDLLMPAPIYYSHRIVEKQTEILKSNVIDWMRPDAKSQVTFLYENDVPTQIDTIVLSVQHTESISLDEIRDYVKKEIIDEVIPKEFIKNNCKIHINPTGKFVTGGPLGDCGLTGRKIIVDTYGGMARHGGGAFSGKDPSKVDRSAAYAARYVAKNIVAAGLADYCEIQVSYAIGVAKPTSINVNTFNSEKISKEAIEKIVEEKFDLRPKSLINMLDLKRPIYLPTAAYGHFGRTDIDLSWERTDKASEISQ